MLMMLPFEAPTIFENIPKPYFRMPRVVKDQRAKFENDDFFRQLSHEGAVKYTGFKDRPLEERQMKFIANCQEGHTEVSVVQSGNQFTLMFNPTANPAYNNEGCDFEKEPGKVHIKAGFILNGVCVSWRGWLDLQRLEGFGCLEFDEYRAYIEEAMLKQQIDKQATCNSGAQGAGANNNLNSSSYNSSANLGAGLSVPSHHAHLSAVASIASNGGNGSCMSVGGPLNGPLQPSSGSLNPLNNCAVGGLAPPPQPPPPSHPLAGGLGGAPPMVPQPPVSLAEAAASAHYSNAIAAAFHQALGVPGGLHGFAGADATTLAAAAAASAALMPPTTHLPPAYTNGTTSNGVPPAAAAAPSVTQPLGPQAINTGAPPLGASSIPTSSHQSSQSRSHHHNHNHNHHHHHHQHQHQNHQTSNHLQQHRSPPHQVNGGQTRSSPSEQDHRSSSAAAAPRHPTKRAAPDTTELDPVLDVDEQPDQTQLDDVDVVSGADIHSTELDFAPPTKKAFKSQLASANHHHDNHLSGHHHHQTHTHHHHRATRRA